MKHKDFPGDPGVKTPHFHLGGTGSIPGWAELRSRMQCGVAKKKKEEAQERKRGPRDRGKKKTRYVISYTQRFWIVKTHLTNQWCN